MAEDTQHHRSVEVGTRDAEIIEDDKVVPVIFGLKFWAGIFAAVSLPTFTVASTVLLAFWHLSDRVLTVENKLDYSLSVQARQQISIDKMDSNREALATAISEVRATKDRVGSIQAAVNRINARNDRMDKVSGGGE